MFGGIRINKKKKFDQYYNVVNVPFPTAEEGIKLQGLREDIP
jgi:hypothetical protein